MIRLVVTIDSCNLLLYAYDAIGTHCISSITVHKDTSNSIVIIHLRKEKKYLTIRCDIIKADIKKGMHTMDFKNRLKIAKKGDKAAMLQVGLDLLYNDNPELVKYEDVAFKFLEKLAKKNNVEALIALANYYLELDNFSKVSKFSSKLIDLNQNEGNEIIERFHSEKEERSKKSSLRVYMKFEDSRVKYEGIIQNFEYLEGDESFKLDILNRAIMYEIEEAYLYLGLIEYQKKKNEKALVYLLKCPKHSLNYKAKKAILDMGGTLPSGIELGEPQEFMTKGSIEFPKGTTYISSLFQDVEKFQTMVFDYIRKSDQFSSEFRQQLQPEDIHIDIDCDIDAGVYTAGKVIAYYSYEGDSTAINYSSGGKIHTSYDKKVIDSTCSEPVSSDYQYFHIQNQIRVSDESKLKEYLKYSEEIKYNEIFTQKDLNISLNKAKIREAKRNLKEYVKSNYTKFLRAKPVISRFEVSKNGTDKIVYLLLPLYTVRFKYNDTVYESTLRCDDIDLHSIVNGTSTTE